MVDRSGPLAIDVDRSAWYSSVFTNEVSTLQPRQAWGYMDCQFRLRLNLDRLYIFLAVGFWPYKTFKITASIGLHRRSSLTVRFSTARYVV